MNVLLTREFLFSCDALPAYTAPNLNGRPDSIVLTPDLWRDE
jgi:hypothetical protein